MASPVISVRELGKQYQLGSGHSHDTLRDHLAHAAGALFRRPAKGAAINGDAAAPKAFWALRDVSFDVQAGEVVGIIGRNGAGKSTLLKILSQITEPSTGEIRVRGRLASLLEVGTGFHAELTGRENIFLNGAILGMSQAEIRRRFDEIVAFSGIEAFLDTPVKRYSSGMYMRLAFAVAAHLDPEILVIDEVLAVGDAQFQAKCLGKMKEVAGAGRTVLFVSHNLDSIERLCHRGLLLEAGSLAKDGPAAAIISLYLHGSSNAENGAVDLSHHPARGRSQKPWIVGLTVKSAAGVPTNHFASLDAMTVEITIDPPGKIENPRVALAIEDAYGRRLTTVASYFTGIPLGPLEEKTCVQCTIPRLNLGSGKYLLSVSIAGKQTGLLDSLPCVAVIDIISQDVYGNGEQYLPIYGPILSEAAWTSRPN
jgi:lipopolysaccharide transport system ATP-binding protein